MISCDFHCCSVWLNVDQKIEKKNRGSARSSIICIHRVYILNATHDLSLKRYYYYFYNAIVAYNDDKASHGSSIQQHYNYLSLTQVTSGTLDYVECHNFYMYLFCPLLPAHQNHSCIAWRIFILRKKNSKQNQNFSPILYVNENYE